MPLDSRLVDAIHTRLMVRYGTRWLNLWNGIDMNLVKADWAETLEGMSPEHVRYALANLPSDGPPTVAQFRQLVPNRVEEQRRLPGPRDPIPPHLVEVFKGMRDSQKATHPKAWAYRLQERERAGEKLTLAQRHMWRAAISGNTSEVRDEADQKRTNELKADAARMVAEYEGEGQ